MGITWEPYVLVGALTALVLTAGCLSGGDPTPSAQSGAATGTAAAGTDQTATPTPSPTGAPSAGNKHPDMDAALYGLTVANNTTAYATDNGLVLDNGRVAVLATLQPNRTVPPTFAAHVVATSGETAQLRVPVEELTALATHRNVSYVRRPPAANTGAATA